MNRRDFIEKAALISAAGLLTTTAVGSTTAAESKNNGKPAIPAEQLSNLQRKMGYSDAEMKQFMKNPRNQKVMGRLNALSKLSVVFEIVKAKGCLVGHQPGERFIFPSGASLDTRNSANRLCAFLMPPMTRMVAVIQERVWEGLDPQPLFYVGQCDDVGLDCNGLGRVIIEARIETPPPAG